MVPKRETKAINKLCVREILSLSSVCGAYFFEFRGQNLVCFGIAYNFNGKFAPKAGKARMRTAFFTRVTVLSNYGLRQDKICFVLMQRQHLLRYYVTTTATPPAATLELRKLCNFSGKTLLIRATTLGRNHYQLMPLA